MFRIESKHMVGKVNWQTICHDRSVVPNIQQTISNFTNNEFQDIIEAWIFSLNPNSQNISLPQVVLELGKLPTSNLKFHLIEKTKEALSRISLAQIKGVIEKPSKSDYETRLRNLKYSLETGIDTSEGRKSGESAFLIEFMDLLRLNRRQTIGHILFSSSDIFRANILFHNASKDAIELSLHLVSPLYGSRVVSLINKLISYLGLNLYSNRKIQELTLMFYEASLKYLMKAAFNGFEVSAWLNLMVNILHIKDSKFNHQLELCEYLGIDVNLLPEGATQVVLIDGPELGKKNEKNLDKFSEDGNHIFLRIEKSMSFLEADGVDLFSFDQLTGDLDLLAGHDPEVFYNQLKQYLRLISSKIRNGAELPSALLEKSLKLFFDNDFHILKGEILLLVETLFPDNTVSVMNLLWQQTVRIVSERKQENYNLLNLISELVCYLSTKYSVKPFIIFEKVNSFAVLPENRYYILHDNRLWKKFVNHPFVTQHSTLKEFKLSVISKHYLEDKVNQVQKLFPGNESPQEFNYGIIRKIRELLQLELLDNEDIAELYQYFKINPELASKLFFQLNSTTSFYDPVNISSSKFWIHIHETLFSNGGCDMPEILRNLEDLSYKDSYIKYMFPYVSRKLFLIAYDNPGLSSSEVFAQLISFIELRPLLPFELRFIEVAKFLLQPKESYVLQRDLQEYKLLNEQSLLKPDIKKLLLQIELNSYGKSELFNFIHILRRFYFEQLVELDSIEQMDIAFKTTGERVCVDDLFHYLKLKKKFDINLSVNEQVNLATEIFWDIVLSPQKSTGSIGFYEKAVTILKEASSITAEVSFENSSIVVNDKINYGDVTIISSNNRHEALGFYTSLNPFQSRTQPHYIQKESRQKDDHLKHSKSFDFNTFRNLVEEKNWKEVSGFSKTLTLEKIAYILKSSQYPGQNNYFKDISRLKALLRQLPETFKVREEGIIFNLIMGLDGNNISGSWKLTINVVYEIIRDEIISLSGHSSLANHIKTEAVLSYIKQALTNIEPDDVKIKLSDQAVPTSETNQKRIFKILATIEAVDAIKVVRYVLEWNRLPLWFSKELQCSTSQFIKTTFDTNPDYFRVALQSAQNTQLACTRLLSYLSIRIFAALLVHEKFINQAESKEYQILHERLIENHLDEQNSVGRLLMQYWIQSKSGKIIKSEFYFKLLTELYRSSFKSVHLFRENLTMHIQQYPIGFQLAFKNIFPSGGSSDIQRGYRKSATLKISTDEVLEKGLRIFNGGIVLINSYLRELFNRLNLLDNNQFISKQHCQKAILALHYFVSGSEVIKSQQDIVINKVLCGCTIDEIFETDQTLSDDDKLTIDGLISAMISHWNAIKTSSIDGFRGNWLIREGNLSRKHQKLNLTIEKKVYDILLNQSPFSFSVIQFPWMTEALYVKWQTV